jgi:hypothetical protein
MFEIFMMATNGAMCCMSGISFLKSLYDNYIHHTLPPQAPVTVQRQPTEITMPPKLVHHASGFLPHDLHKISAAEPAHFVIRDVGLSGEDHLDEA